MPHLPNPSARSHRPPPQALGPAAPLLRHAATAEPWASLLCVVASLLTALLAFVAIPALDFALGRDLRQPTEEEESAKAALYRAVLYAYVPLHVGMLAYMCHFLRWAGYHGAQRCR